MPEGKGLLEISISVIICWTSLSRGSNTFHYTILHLALSADAPDPRKGQRPVCSTGWVWPSHWHWRWQLRTFRSSNDNQRHVWPWRTPGNCSYRSANPCLAPAPGGRGFPSPDRRRTQLPLSGMVILRTHTALHLLARGDKQGKGILPSSALHQDLTGCIPRDVNSHLKLLSILP